MDLTQQPPRRPSNTGMGGIVGLARMTDKARGHNAELIGEYKFGQPSGLDREVLGFIDMSDEEFAELADNMTDGEIAACVRDKSAKTDADIEAFNTSWLEREPQDEPHRKLLVERVAAYAPGNKDIKTVLASMELDDWGMFREKDLTLGPPRTPYLRSVAGIAGVARLGEKARAKKAGKQGDYKYGTRSLLDGKLLEFLDMTADQFQEAAYRNPNDTELAEAIRLRRSFSSGEVSAFNARISSVGLNTPSLRDRFLQRRGEICPDRTDIETFFDLIDYDDEDSFGIVDLNRRPPRSPYDRSLKGVIGLARMIDKGRARNAGTLGAYWFGEDSGFDRRVLEFLGTDQEEFAGALAEHGSDEEVLAWLGDRSEKSEAEIDAFNQTLSGLAPTKESQKSFLKSVVDRLDASRSDIDTFMAMTVLDDRVTFARLRSI